MKYIKLFETYLSTVNNDLLEDEEIIDDKAIEWAKNQFKYLDFKYILNRQLQKDVTYLTLSFVKPDTNKEYKSVVKCEITQPSYKLSQNTTNKYKFSFVA